MVFANSSREELRHKKIAKGGILFDRLTKRTLQIVKKSGLRYFLYTEAQQLGASFAERFSNAIESVLSKGFENVIIIGNDTPQLKVSHLVTASEHLKSGKCVLGPSCDGGFYLLGLLREQFSASDFLRLPWQTARLSKQLTCVLGHSNAEMVEFEPFVDIDSIGDIEELTKLTTRLTRDLISLLVSFINIRHQIGTTRSSIFDFQQIPVQFNKGSPFRR